MAVPLSLLLAHRHHEATAGNEHIDSFMVEGLTFHIMVGLTNRGFLGGADRGKPRVDWRDLET